MADIVELESKTSGEKVEITPTFVKKSDPEADALKQKGALPPKPGERVGLDQLVEWLRLLKTKEQKERISLYVYRTYPLIIRQQVDPDTENNIDVLSEFEKVSRDYIIATHGGGRYKIVVKDSGIVGKRKGFFEADLEVPITEHLPKLDFAEVDWDSQKNRGFQTFCRHKGLIDEKNMATIEKKETIGGETTVQTTKLLLDFVTKMNEKDKDDLKKVMMQGDSAGKQVQELLLEKLKQDDPNKAVTNMAAMVTAMKGMIPDAPKTTGVGEMVPLLTAIMTTNQAQMAMMMESSKADRAMMLELLKAQSGGKEEDETTKLKNLLEIAKMMKGNTAPEVSTADRIIEAVANILPQGLVLVNNVMAANMHKAGVQGTQAPPPTQQNGTVTPAPTQQPTQEEPMQLTMSQKQQLLKGFVHPIKLAFTNSKEGWEFAADLESMYGADAVGILIKDGAEELIKVAKTVPEIWTPLVQSYGEPHVTKWVHDLCNYKEMIAKAEKEDEDENV